MAEKHIQQQDASTMHLAAVDYALDSRPLGIRRGLILLLCLMILILDGLDFQLLAFAGPLLIKDWGIDKVALSTALGLALIGMAIGAPAGGWAGDRWGPRISLVLAAVLFGTATLATAAARDLLDLQVLRLLSGFGFGAAIPNAMALASGWSGPRRRGPLIAIMTIGTPIGAAVGGPLSAWLMPDYGWRISFVVSGALTLAVTAILFLVLLESPSFLVLKHRHDRAKALLRRFLWREFDFSSGQEGGSNARLPENRLVPLSASNKLRTNLTLWISFFATAYAAYAYLSWLPTMLVDTGFPLTSAIGATAVYSFATIGGSLLATISVTRLLPWRIILPSVAVKFSVTLFLAFALHELGTSAVVFLIGLAGLCTGLAITSLYVLTPMAYPPARQARAIGFCVGFSRAGGIVTVFGGGVLLSVGTSGAEFLLGGIAVLLLAGGAAMVIFARARAPIRRPEIKPVFDT